MPAKTRKSEQSAERVNTDLPKKLGIKNILAISIFVVAAGVAIVFIMGGNLIFERMRFESYLSDKYGQEFVVENVRVTGAGLGVKGSWRGDAYPESDPSVKFEIRRFQETGQIDYETFLQSLWTKQGMGEVKDLLSREFPNKEYSYLRISPGNSPGNPLYDLVQGETLSLEDALKDYKDIMIYELAISDVVPSISDEPSAASLEKAMRVLNFVKSKGVGVPSVNYGYRDSTFTERNKWGEQKYQYRIKLERDELQSVSSPDDLRQYFQVIDY